MPRNIESCSVDGNCLSGAVVSPVENNDVVNHIDPDPREFIPASGWDEGHEGPYMGFASKKEAAMNGHFVGACGILYFGWDDPRSFDY